VGGRTGTRRSSRTRISSQPFAASRIAARPDWIEELVDLQIATSFVGPGPIGAELIAGVLAGELSPADGRVRQRLTKARKQAGSPAAAARHRRGGFYLWCRLPDGCDSTGIARRCLAENVVLEPGSVFRVSQSAASSSA
jgi:DNA-binding transcriptional MocR family regulator